MKYLPFEHIIYSTNLSEEEVFTRLSGFVEPEKFGFKKRSDKEYEGYVYESGFEISRIIKNRNSFAPDISGIIQKNNKGAQIEVKMRLKWYVLIFLIGWCLLAILFLLVMLVKVRDIIDILLPLFMLAFVYALTMIGFKIESNQSKDDFKKYFAAEIERE
ncbi:hypothetical protein [Chryseobacterium jejuense]|uniref:Uncharacterized protein n=1 Tax=Chryseobacterium jejuense TaxID=445960 RepID=A0A2X2X1K5_CHRJE|nr:hypothetical protein [Chryseobacterium jejuense]SDI17128.1 hypothetical protein SAMN05421542_0305 [Chryseobacterium jejuense]SQB46574.1 Uncharacterised protein [Chryseobacterium jejuense]